MKVSRKPKKQKYSYKERLKNKNAAIKKAKKKQIQL